jgi:hypothetical protein
VRFVLLVQFYPALQQPLQQMYDNRARFMAMAQNGPPETPPSNSADESSSPSGATFFTGRARRPRSRGEEQQQGLLSSSCEQSVVSVCDAMNGRGRRGDGSSDDASSSDSDAGNGSAAGSPGEDRKLGSKTEQQATSSA